MTPSLASERSFDDVGDGDSVLCCAARCGEQVPHVLPRHGGEGPRLVESTDLVILQATPCARVPARLTVTSRAEGAAVTHNRMCPREGCVLVRGSNGLIWRRCCGRELGWEVQVRCAWTEGVLLREAALVSAGGMLRAWCVCMMECVWLVRSRVSCLCPWPLDTNVCVRCAGNRASPIHGQTRRAGSEHRGVLQLRTSRHWVAYTPRQLERDYASRCIEVEVVQMQSKLRHVCSRQEQEKALYAARDCDGLWPRHVLVCIA